MDALYRLKQISRTPRCNAWPCERFREKAVDGKRRWEEVEQLFQIRYSMFQDAVGTIAPTFSLTTEEEADAYGTEMPSYS